MDLTRSSSGSQPSDFWSMFQNRNFALLWTSQVFGQSAQNAILFVHMVMIEGLTRSSTLVGLMVLVFNLPGVLFSLLSGVMIDRFRKKTILLFCNISRIFVVASFIFFRRYAQGGGLLTAVYLLTFVLSTIGQLSDPAEAAMVPLLVAPDQLLTANSAFRLLFNVAQVLGLLFLAPLSLKLGGIDGAFATISGAYLITTALIWPISLYEPSPHNGVLRNSLITLREELNTGLRFILTNRPVLIAIGQHGLMNVLTMIIAVLVPGFAARVLGMPPTDAIYIFFAGGVGMFIATLWVANYGSRFQRPRLVATGLLIVGLALAALSIVALNVEAEGGASGKAPDRVIIPVVGAALVLGAGGTVTVVASQTIIHELTPMEIRGRVISADFLLANIAGLAPMMAVSTLADYIGIPNAIMGLSGVLLASAFLSFRVRRQERVPLHVQPG